MLAIKNPIAGKRRRSYWQEETQLLAIGDAVAGNKTRSGWLEKTSGWQKSLEEKTKYSQKDTLVKGRYRLL